METGTRAIELFSGVGKLAEAIRTLIDDIFTTMLEKFADEMEYFAATAHEAAHAILSVFGAIFRFSPSKNAYVIAYYAIPMLVPNLKHITLNFLEHAGEVRKSTY